MIDQLARSWLGLPERTRRIVAVAMLVLVPALFTTLAYAVLVTALAAGVAFAATGPWGWRLRAVAAGIGGPVLLIALGLAFHGLPRPALPGPPVAIQVSQPPTPAEAQQLELVAPGTPEAWIAAGLAASSPYEAAIAYQKALLVDPTSRQAAYNIAAAYLQSGRDSGGILDEEVAAYYLTLAGYPAPPNAPPIGLSH